MPFTCLAPLQEVFRQGNRVVGDLVLITGLGHHSAGSPVLRSSVQRLLASLQLSPDDADLTAGASAAAGGMGSAFAGYARFTGSRRAQHSGASSTPPPGVGPQQRQDQPPQEEAGALEHVDRSLVPK